MTTPARTGATTRVEPGSGTRALGNGVLFLLGSLADPAETFHRARGRRYWWSAAVLLGAVMAVDLSERESHPFLWVVLPVLLLLSLMATYPLTSLARVICGGPSWLTDATASQTVVLTSAALLPASLLALLGVPALTTAAVGLVCLVVAMVAAIALWSAAFGCRWYVAALACVATAAITITVAVPVAALVGPTLDYLTG